VDADYLTRGLSHAAATWLVCVLVTLAVSTRRLHLTNYPEPTG
jgi:hypothetical protein